MTKQHWHECESSSHQVLGLPFPSGDPSLIPKPFLYPYKVRHYLILLHSSSTLPKPFLMVNSMKVGTISELSYFSLLLCFPKHKHTETHFKYTVSACLISDGDQESSLDSREALHKYAVYSGVWTRAEDYGCPEHIGQAMRGFWKSTCSPPSYVSNMIKSPENDSHKQVLQDFVLLHSSLGTG